MPRRNIEISPPPPKRSRRQAVQSVPDNSLQETIEKTMQAQFQIINKSLDDRVKKMNKELTEAINKQVRERWDGSPSPTNIRNQQNVIQDDPATAHCSNSLQPGDMNIQDKADTHGSRDGPTDMSLEDQTLQQVLQSVLGNESDKGEHQAAIATLCSDELPLGAALSEKITQKIKVGEYVDLYSLIHPLHDQQTITVNTIEGKPSINIKQLSGRKISNIEQWTHAMLIYGAIHVQANPAEAAGFFKYLDFIRSMARSSQNTSWIKYDELFRRVREKSARPWDKPLIIQYINVLNQTNNSFSKANSSKQSHNSNQPFRSRSIPKSFCFSFHTSGLCTRKPCIYSHTCFNCQGAHSRINCKSYEQNSKSSNLSRK